MRSIETGLITAVLFCVSAQAGGWAPAPSPLTTPWTAKVDPTNPWPEYPRPQMVRARWTNLNGLWDYAIAAKSADQPAAWDGKILVPFCIESSLSGVGKRVSADQRLWYRRSFSSSDLKAGEHLILHFGAIDWQAQIFINGRKIATHEGGYDPIRIDVTDALKSSGENELIVAVWDPTDADSQPRGKQAANPEGIWYTPVTGIWQTVWLEPIPAAAIDSIKLTPNVDQGKLDVFVQSTGLDAYEVEAIALDDGKQVATVAGECGKTISIKLDDAKLWSPDAPHLYDLKIILKQNGTVLDEVTSYFAMRKISLGKDAGGYTRLMLNNQSCFHLGPLDQGWWPDGLYTAPTDEALKYDIEMTRKLGLNMCRKHIKVEPARWYYWADKLGLMVWQDMPSGAASSQASRHFVSPDAKQDAVFNPIESDRYARELKAMIDHLYNSPCVVVWVPFNEGWGQHDTNDILTWVKQYDPTRLVDGPSGWQDRGVGDMHDMHNYPGPGMFPVQEGRASVLGEFGGLGWPVPEHIWQNQKNWGYRTYQSQDELNKNYAGILRALAPLASQGLSAAVYTQTTDVEGEVNGYLSYDRKVVKMDIEKLNALHKAVLDAGKSPCKSVTLLPTAEHAPQEYRYTTKSAADGWMNADFDDSTWQVAPAPFGSQKADVPVRTEWASTDIWVRRSFESDTATLNSPHLRIWHDETAEVYLNGKLIATLNGFSGGYTQFPLDKSAKEAWKQGTNVLAIHCHQTIGGQGIDAGLIDLIPVGK